MKINRKMVYLAIPTIAVMVGVVLFSGGDIVRSAAIGSDPSPYSCVVPEGYTSIKDINKDMRNATYTADTNKVVTSTLNNHEYNTFGTVTKTFYGSDGFGEYLVQSQGYAVMIYKVGSPSVGNFIKLEGVKVETHNDGSGSNYFSRLYGGAVTVLYETNPYPVTTLDLTASLWNNTSTKAYGNVAVKLSALTLTTIYGGDNVSYTNVPKFSFTDATVTDPITISGFWMGYQNSSNRSNLLSYYTNANDLVYDGYLIPTYSGSASSTASCTLRFFLYDGSELSIKEDTNNKKIDLVSLNDLHGGVETSGYVLGLAKWSSWISENLDRNKGLLLANGDMWQGNGESNLNKGKLVTEWMNLENFACMNIGNHDFDWGTAAINANKEVANFPFINSNIYNYDKTTGQVGTKSDLGDSYVVKTINGVKVGIIGAIGRDQYTSITSSMVDGFEFKDPYDIIKDTSDYLRTNNLADVIVLEMHAAQDSSSTVLTDVQELCETSSVSNKRYIDVGFFGHVHTNASYTYNGVPLLRAAGDTNGVSKASITYNTSTETVTLNSSSSSYITVSSYEDDTTAKALVDSYAETQDAILNVSKGTLVGTLTSSAYGANLSAKLMYDAASTYLTNNPSLLGTNPSLTISIANTNRNDLSASTITYRDCYKALPFDNKLVIGTVSGSDAANEAGYNKFYNPTGMSKPSGTTLYTIVTYDYLAYHQNASHVANYFPSLTVIAEIDDEDYLMRNLLASYFVAQSTVTATDYTGTLYSWAS